MRACVRGQRSLDISHTSRVGTVFDLTGPQDTSRLVNISHWQSAHESVIPMFLSSTVDVSQMYTNLHRHDALDDTRSS